MQESAISPLLVILNVIAVGIMIVVMRWLFKNSVLFKIGISTATAMILVSFLSGMVSKLSPVNNLWVFPLQVTIGVMAYIYISAYIKKPLRNNIRLIKSVSGGNLRTRIDSGILELKDEIGEIGRSMKQLQEGLQEKAKFAYKIGKGEFDDSFEKLSEEDELGEALLNMQQSLKDAREQDQLRKEKDARHNWITEGQALFAGIIRQNTSDVSELSHKIISNMVNYMKINQGGLFILNDDDPNDKFLEMTACYAFDRRKFLEKRIDIGEGLVGTCYLEGESIYMKEIPQDYISITSGLGEENPTDLLIVPLKLNDEIFGVMELASFTAFEKHHIEFAERIGEIIASSISGLRINNRTAMLLEKSQQQAEEMRAQEEEMRQNMEELHATQEAMAEKERDNVEKINTLVQENKTLKESLRQAQEKIAELQKQ